MDVMELRRGLLMQMAQGGSSILDSLLELYTTVRVETDTKEIIIDSPGGDIFDLGLYLLVANPITSPQDAIDKNDYSFVASSFVIHGTGTTRTIRTGQSYIFNRQGQSDYWGIAASYVDTTRTQIKANVGSSAVWFLANHDVLVYRVKSE